ncbi:MAG: hypothetical protein JJT94_11880 [Bernardetiaceae bacterium]|nr:hypothetical protein [Bernardetiaceae bacterium]
MRIRMMSHQIFSWDIIQFISRGALRTFGLGLLLFYLLIGQSIWLEAQIFPSEKDRFGKNRVQYREFEWEYYSTANFSIYFYDKHDDLARITAEIAESEFRRIRDLIGFSPYSRLQIFVYRTTEELQQSNLGIRTQDFKIGGQTNFAKSVLEIAFTGSRESFRRELIREITSALLYEMMYGGNFKEVLQSSYLLNLPEWFIAGAAAYIADGANAEMDDFIRINLHRPELLKWNYFTDKEAELLGKSVWHFMVERYGINVMSNVLNLTRILRNEQHSIENTIGLEYDQFIKRWEDFYIVQQLSLQKELYRQPHKDEIIISQYKKFQYDNAVLSPDKKFLAYSRHRFGRYRVVVKNLSNGKEKIVLKSGLYVINQKTNHNLPLIAWQDDKHLAIVTHPKEVFELDIYSIDTEKTEKMPFPDFQNVQHIAFHSNGRQLVLSAERKLQADIYLFSIYANRLQQITDDEYDNIYPTFVAQSDKIVFSSNRRISEEQSSKNKHKKGLFNLFLYDPAKPSAFEQLTNTTGNDLHAQALDTESMLYLSDNLGIKHLYKLNLEKKSSVQISNLDRSIKNYQFSGGDLLLQSRYIQRYQWFHLPSFDTEVSIFTGKTPLKQLKDSRNVQEIRQQAKEDIEKEKKASEQENKKDKIDTDNYEFDTDEKTDKPKRKRLLKDYDRFAKQAQSNELIWQGPQSYRSLFAQSETIVSLYSDPLRNFGLLGQVNMTDALENHKIDLGIFLPNFINFTDGMLFGEYSYLTNRFDYKLRFDRQGYSIATPTFTQQYTINKISGTVSYPFNITTRLSASPFLAQTRFNVTDIDPAVLAHEDVVRSYSGASINFVFDNSFMSGPNMPVGTRFKASLDSYVGVNSPAQSFGNLMLDARHYVRLNSLFTIATRFAYGKFFGAGGSVYRLGGVDNWIFQRAPELNTLSQEDPFFLNTNDPASFANDYSGYLFMQYATPMRGFDFNKLSGSDFMLINFEVRMPIVQAIAEANNLRSRFLQNFQIVAFTDIGSAWTGASPFSRENSINTTFFDDNNAFFAKVSNYKDPFLIGYGLGLRSSVFNYFTKLDVAWGLEDGLHTGPHYYLSFGFDF